MSEQDVVQRMLQQGGAKPTATEYLLQQVIFVVPAGERAATLGKRKREAEAMRERFSSCETTRQFAKGLIDVTVRDLGRVLAPQLAARMGGQHQERQARHRHQGARDRSRRRIHRHLLEPRGVGRPRRPAGVPERRRSDDKKGDELSKKYVAELREKARIVER